MFVENLLPGKISEVTFLFWQQMAVFSGTIALYLLATKESYTTFLSQTTSSSIRSQYIQGHFDFIGRCLYAGGEKKGWNESSLCWKVLDIYPIIIFV